MTVRDLGLLAVTVNELVDRIAEQKFIVSISIEDSELVVKYSDDTVVKFELPIVESGIITKELDYVELEKAIATLLKQEIEIRLQNIIDSVVKLVPKPKDGEDGQSVDEQKIIESLQTAITKKLEHEVEKIKQSIPEPINGVDGKDADEEKIVEKLKSVLLDKLESELAAIRQSIPEPIVLKDGKDADEEAIKTSLLEVVNAQLKEGLEKIVAEIPIVRDEIDGKDADEESIKNSLMSVLDKKINGIKEELNKQLEQDIKNLKSSIPQAKDGVNGRDGRDADNEFILSKLEITLNNKIEIIKSELSNLIAEKSNSIKDGVNGRNGKDADEQKILKRLSSEINAKLDAYQKELSGNLAESIADAVEKIKADIPTPKNGVDGKDGKSIKGDKGERGNGIKNAKIDSRDHLIITTDDKIIDAGEVSKKFFSSFGFSYTNELPMPFDVGGFKKGTRFKDVDLKVLWTKLLYGYDLPFFSSFTIVNLPQEVEIGYILAAGDYQAEFEITNSELLRENSIVISQDGTTLLDRLPNVSPVTLTLLDNTQNIPASTSFEILAYDTTGTSFSKSFAVNYKYKIYYGEYTEDITDTGFTNPLSVLRASELIDRIYGEYLFLNIGYKWFCYPEALGEHYIFYEITSDIALVFDEVEKIIITNDYGLAITYNCYRTLHEIHEEFIMGVK